MANYRSINLEALLAQKPDLVVAWRSAQARMLGPVERLGIPSLLLGAHRLCLPGHRDAQPGHLLGLTPRADEQARAYLTRLDALAARYGEPKPLSVFYQLWYPPLTSVTIDLAGAGHHPLRRTQHHGEYGSSLPQVGLEQVIKANPGLILAGGRDPSVLDHWRQWLHAGRRQTPTARPHQRR